LSKLPDLAFDHQEIINTAIHRVRNKINYTNVGFELVPKLFTIPELRETFEKVLGRKINSTNFRTKILKLDILKKTKQKRIQGKGQPAPLYSLDLAKFAKKVKNGETLFN
jgi:8-oxo-dGTP diphosphatase